MIASLLKPLFTPQTPEAGGTTYLKLLAEAQTVASWGVSSGDSDAWANLVALAPKMSALERSSAVSAFTQNTAWQSVVQAEMLTAELEELKEAWMAKASLSTGTQTLATNLWGNAGRALEIIERETKVELTAEEKVACQEVRDSSERDKFLAANSTHSAAWTKLGKLNLMQTSKTAFEAEISYAELKAHKAGMWSRQMGFSVGMPINLENVFIYFSAARQDFKPKLSRKMIEKAEAREKAALQATAYGELSKKAGYLGASIHVEDLLEHASVLQYDKYDAELVRQRVLALSRGRSSLLIDLLLVAIFLGNNYIERAKRTMEPEAANQIIESLAVFEMKRRKVTSSTITPSRVSGAFPKVVLALRRELQSRGMLPDTGLTVSTPDLYRDLSMSGMSEELKKGKSGVDVTPYLEEMAKRFAEALRKKDKKLELSDEDAIATMHKFRALAVAGHDSDIVNRTIPLEVQLSDAAAAYGFT